MYINISLSTVNDQIFLSFVVICFSQQDEYIISTSDLDLLKKKRDHTTCILYKSLIFFWKIKMGSVWNLDRVKRLDLYCTIVLWWFWLMKRWYYIIRENHVVVQKCWSDCRANRYRYGIWLQWCERLWHYSDNTMTMKQVDALHVFFIEWLSSSNHCLIDFLVNMYIKNKSTVTW